MIFPILAIAFTNLQLGWARIPGWLPAQETAHGANLSGNRAEDHCARDEDPSALFWLSQEYARIGSQLIGRERAAAYSNAVRVLKRAKHIFEQRNDSKSAEMAEIAIGQSWLDFGTALRDEADASEGDARGGLYRDALEALNKACKAFNASSQVDTRALAIARSSQCYAGLGDWSSCIAACDEVLAVKGRTSNLLLLCRTGLQKAAAHTKLGEFDLAAQVYGDVELWLKDLPLEVKPDIQGAVWNGFGLAASIRSEYAAALDYYTRAASIYNRLQQLDNWADAMNNQGLTLASLGRFDEALLIFDKVTRTCHDCDPPRSAAVSMMNRADTLRLTGRYTKSAEAYTEASQEAQKFDDEYTLADCQHGLGLLQIATSDLESASATLTRAIQTRKKVGDKWGIGLTEGAFAELYAKQGRLEEASVSGESALELLSGVGDRDGQATVLATLMHAFATADRPAAILFGKSAIALLQDVRSNLTDLSPERQIAFAESKAPIYRDLSALLVSEGRFLEAEQVIRLLKVEEAQEYSRGTRGGPPESIALTTAESEKFSAFKMISSDLVRLMKERQILSSKVSHSHEEESRLEELDDEFNVANGRLHEWFNGLAHSIDSSPLDINAVGSVSSALQHLPETLALYLVPTSKGLVSLYVYGRAKEGRIDTSISSDEINALAFRFHRALMDPTQDPVPAAKRLYDLLIRPLDPVIRESGAKTIIFSLDGALQYVPMAALHDGHGFLVERFACESFSPTLTYRLSTDSQPVSSSWRALGVGVSARVAEGFEPLPAVATELENICGKSGIFQGRLLINSSFTKHNLAILAGESYDVIHVASHFHLDPLSQSASYLLLGDGHRLTVEDLWNMDLSLNRTSLMALSACETAFGSGGSGAEIEGLAQLVQDHGVKSVIASLWPVADEPTCWFMTNFYSNWTRGNGTSKGGALRATQLAMLNGELTGAPGRERRRADLLEVNNSREHFAFDKSRPYAHPYYWAPFILMGDWR